MKVLFISLWYPHKNDPMLGLFVQKHAEAVRLYAEEVVVLFIHPVENTKTFEIAKDTYNGLTEYRIHYPITGTSLWGKITKQINYIRAYRKGFKVLKKDGFKPDIIHTNVLTRTPLIAYIYKLFTKTPYVITEHWTRLLKSQNSFNGFCRNLIAQLVVKNASYIMPVSSELKDGLIFNKLLLTKCKIVENVVDSCFYETYPTEEKHKKQLVNVTCFYEKHKNLFGLLRAIKAISNERDDFQLVLIGTGDDFDMTYDYYKSLAIPEDTVVFAGLKTSIEVAEIMQNADAIVQFSNYESAGVVVQEALVSGKPVISTKVGIAPDYIQPTNGILVDIGDEDSLKNALIHVLDNLDSYNNEAIRSNAKYEFSYERIGEKYYNIYKEVLNNKLEA